MPMSNEARDYATRPAKVRLGDACEILENLLDSTITGEWGEECAPGAGVFVLRTTNFTNVGEVSYADVVERAIAVEKVRRKKLQPGDIILEKSGGTKDCPVGRVVYFDREEGTYLCNNFTQVLRPAADRVFPRYLFYALFAKYKMRVTDGLYNKTTGIQNLQVKKYLKLPIPVRSIPEQKRIAARFDAICEIISKREEQLKKLNQLVKSRFVEAA